MLQSNVNSLYLHHEMDSPPITQSLIKALSDYAFDRECGKRIEAQYLEGIEFSPSDAMLVGIYFEYSAFGTFPKNGKRPIPKTTKSKKGQSDKQGTLTKPYEIAVAQAEKIKAGLKHHGLKIIGKGEKLRHVMDDGTVVEGTTDLRLETTKPLVIYNHETGHVAKTIPAGVMIIGDAKSTGLLGDRGKWSEMGWHIDFVDQKPRLLIQAVHYTYLARNIYGLDEVPFIFFVYSQSNDISAMMLHVTIDPERYPIHEETIVTTRRLLELEIRLGSDGFRAKPELERCGSCDLFAHCKDRMEYPKIFNINY
jgi:hypothetical protein